MQIPLQAIKSNAAPQPIGPYSQAIISANSLLFISGQIPWDMHTQQIVIDTRAATRLVMDYLAAILQQAGMDFTHVVKTSIFLTSMEQFPVVNEVYASYFSHVPLPARETVAVVALPKGAPLEISLIAFRV
jgi:2-iminobutanoate/2-iminopropanoate deaminase